MNIFRIKRLGYLLAVFSSINLGAAERFVSSDGGHVSPFTSWPNAATNIQAAIDVAAAGDVITVTNGIYSTGGKVMAGDLTNRVVLNKALTVRSVNGPLLTTIQGMQGIVSTNGPGAVRCAWLTNGAFLSGFTIFNGATRTNGDFTTLQSGGGAWCASTNATITNCLFTGNTAFGGGGSYQGTLRRCTLSNNVAVDGGAVANGYLVNCYIVGNKGSHAGGGTFGCTVTGSTISGNLGGGAYGGNLLNCTVVGNSNPFPFTRAGVASASVSNCIVYFNSPANYTQGTLSYSCSFPLPAGAGNISADPQLMDQSHIAIASQCVGSGIAITGSGVDIDGESWASPPSMGCDEVFQSALIGPLSVTVEAPQTDLLVNRTLSLIGRITGRATRLEWSFGDGSSATNVSYLTTHIWTNAGDYLVTFTAFNTDNPAGVSSNLTVHILPLAQPSLQSAVVTTNSFRFDFVGQSGANYFIERATNLISPVTWQTIQTLSSTGGVHQVTDSVSANAAQFYRVRAQ